VHNAQGCAYALPQKGTLAPPPYRRMRGGMSRKIFLESTGGNNMKDVINPSHYQRDGLECIDAIEAAVQNLSGAEAYATGSAIKYLWRWKEKGGKDDLNKAKWFIQKMVDYIEELEFQEEIEMDETIFDIAKKL
jgi:hypothetical protein